MKKFSEYVGENVIDNGQYRISIKDGSDIITFVNDNGEIFIKFNREPIQLNAADSQKLISWFVNQS